MRICATWEFSLLRSADCILCQLLRQTEGGNDEIDDGCHLIPCRYVRSLSTLTVLTIVMSTCTLLTMVMSLYTLTFCCLPLLTRRILKFFVDGIFSKVLKKCAMGSVVKVRSISCRMTSSSSICNPSNTLMSQLIYSLSSLPPSFVRNSDQPCSTPSQRWAITTKITESTVGRLALVSVHEGCRDG